jgi:hypothetical protein
MSLTLMVYLIILTYICKNRKIKEKITLEGVEKIEEVA